MDHKRLKLAYHETGHAVMALICGQPIRKVSLREMDSPLGTDKYLGSTLLEPFELKPTITINESNRRIMISLAGFAGDGLFSEGVIGNFGGDDLTRAIQLVENMLENEMFRNFVAGLPVPALGTYDVILSPLVGRYIDYMMQKCLETLAPLKPAIHSIAEELYKREELSGEDVSTLFNAFETGGV
jgi:ATP-dependent Zn protease